MARRKYSPEEIIQNIDSRIPALKKIKSINIDKLKQELKVLIDDIEISGLVYKIKHSLNQLIQIL